jgi:murein DD-endopeptidase MepM/ murein hydrolase activator NlpD
LASFKLIGTNLVTAVATAAVTSAFWIVAYSNGGSSLGREAGPERAEKRASMGAEVTLGPTGLAIPVSGIKPTQLADTYKQARGGGARVHDAIDIMAPHGTPVIAAAPGKLEKLFFSKGGGGLTAYVRSDDGRWIYYYAHLQDYAPGLKEGQSIERGDPIGRVGVTGNSNPDGPHLHFAIHRMSPGESWHEGTAINPYPLLAGKK